MLNFTDLTNESILPKVNLNSLPEIKISNALKDRLKQMFESAGDLDNVKIMDYSSSIRNRKSGNTSIFPNQYFLIAAYFFDYATALIAYFSFFDAKIRDKKDLEQIIYEKEYDRIPSELFSGDEEQKLFIKFLRVLGKDFVNKDKDSVKSRPTIDVFGSCVLSKMNVPNASSSVLGETIYYLSTNIDVYKSLKEELVQERILISSKNAVGFLMDVLKLTLKSDSDFSQLAEHFKENQTTLRVNGFAFGRNVKQLPTRESDYDLSISWSYNNNRYCAYKEIIPQSLVQDFFPQYNDSYKNMYRLEEKDGKFLMFEVNGNRFDRDVPTESVLDYSQIIYYGVPGTGKSFQVDEEINKAISKYNEGKTEDNKISYEKQTTRIVFHPDYGNADFIGQIMPKIRESGGVDYVFKAGPFSQILRKAYLNPNKPYFLVIEEINRGNAAAIFGDIFQSLDRLKNNESSDGERIRNEVYKYTAGWSKYGVTNEEINSYILDIEKNFERDSNIDYDSDDPTNAPKAAIKIPARGMHFSINSAIRLPPNLSIYATMNTSDQNVFTLDNAFQRRWEMKQISNDLAHDDPAADTTKQYNQIIGNTNVKWGEFREAINEIIMQSAEENGLSSMEDKRLGGWFITPKKEPNAAEGETPTITKEAFAEKVLKYLWDDAFKFDRSKHFGEIKTLEDLTKKFKTDGFKIFKDESISKLSQQNGTSAAQTGTPES